MKRLYNILRLLLMRNGFHRANFIKNHKLFGSIGDNCYYHPFLISAESKNIFLGNNVVISKNVELVTHDMSYTLFKNDDTLISKIGNFKYPYYTDKIVIGNNVMIGANAIILPGVKIGSNVIIGAGSLVSHDVQDGTVVGGVPAHVIGNYYDYAKKRGETIS